MCKINKTKQEDLKCSIRGNYVYSWRRKTILAINIIARSLFVQCVCVILLGV